MQVSPSTANSLYGPLHPPFSRQTRTSDCNGRSNVLMILGPLRIARASFTWRSARRRRTSLVAARVGFALLIAEGDGGSISVILGYAPKTSNVGIIPSGPAESLTAF